MITHPGRISSAHSNSSTREGHLTERILLYPGELYRVSPSHRQVQVVHGTAYLSHGGKDYIVQPCEAIKLEGANDSALVSSVRNEPLVIELFI